MHALRIRIYDQWNDVKKLLTVYNEGGDDVEKLVTKRVKRLEKTHTVL